MTDARNMSKNTSKILEVFFRIRTSIRHSINVSLSTDKSFESYGAFVGLRIVVFKFCP